MTIDWKNVKDGAQAIASLFGAGASLVNGANSAKGLRDQYAYNKALMKEQYAYNVNMYKHRYQWQIEDLEKAGINKLYGLGEAPTTQVGGSSVGLPDYSKAKSSKAQRIVELLGMAQNWSAKKAQIENIKQQTETEYYNTQLKMYESVDKEYQSLLSKKELDGWEQKRKLELQKIKSEIENNLAGADEARSGSTLNRTNARRVNQDIEHNAIINKPEEEQAKDQEEWLKKNPKLKRVITYGKELKEVLGILGGAAVGGAGVYKMAGKKAVGTAARAAKNYKTQRYTNYQ